MRIPLDSFEQYIEDKILQRGLSYWKKGHVGPSELIESDLWEFTVYGTEDYIVRLRIINNVVETYSCSCPYDMGDVCKHVAAVLFELQKDTLFLEETPKPNRKNSKNSRDKKASSGKKGEKTKTPKRKTVAQQIEEILKQVDDTILRSFVRELALKDRSFRSLFTQEFIHLAQDESQQFYVDQLRLLLKSAAGRDGYIDYRSAQQIGKIIDGYLANAQTLMERGDVSVAMNIAMTVAREINAALQHADDSSGNISGGIEAAMYMLKEIADNPHYSSVHEELFTWLTEAFEKKIFEGWDWHFGIFQIAMGMSEDRIRALRLLELLDTQEHKNYEKEIAVELRFKILKRMGDEETALNYIYSNLHLPGIRRLYLQHLLAEQKFDKIIALAHEGITLAEKQKQPGLVNEWYQWLIKIAQLQKDTENTIIYATQLFLRSSDAMPYFSLLKTLIQPLEWPFFVDTLIQNLQEQNTWLSVQRINEVCVYEQRWDTLMQNLRSEPSLYNLEHFSPYLATLFPDELATMYEKNIRAFLERSVMDRSHYREACHYLRSMQKIAGNERAQRFIVELKEKHPKRPALHDELTKVQAL